jgi:Protein of unknown function (DUF1364)
MSYRSPLLLKSADGQSCVRCGAIGTTVACHANSVALGKGTGVKAPDWTAVHLCVRCHAEYDGRIGRLTKAEKEELWQRAFIRTMARYFEQGIVVVRGQG